MINSGPAPRPSALSAGIRLLPRFKWFLGLSLAVGLTVRGVAQTAPQQNPDQQYIAIMTMIDRADALRAAGQTNAARAKLLQAEKALMIFKGNNPLFDPKIVNYRLKEVTGELNTRPPIPEMTNGPAAEKPKTNSSSLATQSGGTNEFKLLDPGAEPRSVLRLHPKAGDKQNMTIAVKLSAQVPMPAPPQGQHPGEAAPPSSQTLKLPPVTIPLDITVQSVAPNGDITFQGVLGELSVADAPGSVPQIAQGLKSLSTSIKGMTLNATMTSRGIFKNMDVAAGEGAPPQMRQMLATAKGMAKDRVSDFGMQLPNDAVGTGAKWEVQRTAKTFGMSVDQTEDYELVSVQGDNLKIKLTITQKASDQKIENPLLGNAQMNLNQLTSTRSGTMDVDLSKLFGSASIDSHMEMSADVAVRNKKQPIDMTMDMNIDIEAK